MAKKICRVYIAKDSVKPKLLPVLAREVRDLIETCLFNQLRASYDELVKDLQDPKKRAELLTRFPELKDWETPTDKELRELVEQEQCDYDGQGGWSYSILDEPTCVTGTLEIFVAGYQAKVIGSSWGAPSEHPGFKFSEQTIND